MEAFQAGECVGEKVPLEEHRDLSLCRPCMKTYITHYRKGKTLLPPTSVLTEEGVVADGARFGEGVELVQPLSGDVELQQAGLLHAGQSHHLLPLSHRLLAAFPAGNKYSQ